MIDPYTVVAYMIHPSEARQGMTVDEARVVPGVVTLQLVDLGPDIRDELTKHADKFPIILVREPSFTARKIVPIPVTLPTFTKVRRNEKPRMSREDRNPRKGRR